MKLRIFLLALSAILLAAHFLRTFSISLSAPFILLIKKRGSLLAVQALTVVAATIWLFTLQGIIQLRIQEGRSWTASAIILGVVAGCTILTGWLLNSPVVKEKYP